MNKAATCYTIYWDDVLVGFFSVLPAPSGVSKYGRRVSRTVILPDYQNLGFGTKIFEFLGEYYLSQGYKYFFRSTHLRLGAHSTDSPKWKPTSHNGRVSDSSGGNISLGNKDNRMQRVAYAFEYMGDDYVNKPHIEMHVDDNSNIDYDIMKSDLEYLKDNYWICMTTGEINTPSKIEDICRELGIRTQLLYSTRKGISQIGNRYKKKKIITVWDKAFSNKVRRYYDKELKEK